jgi:uncharacterized protein (TIGR02217 family)
MVDVGIFPHLAGQGWSVTKTPTFQTRVQRAVSGREMRALDYPYPLWQFQLTYAALGDGFGVPNAVSIGSLLATDLRTLLGFFMACQGAYGTFLYDDPTDNGVVGQPIGLGDGETVTWQLVRSMPGFTEPMTAPNGPTVLMYWEPPGGSGPPLLQPSWTYSVDGSTGLVTFEEGAPPAGWQVTATFNYFFRCRFMSDAYDFENFMRGLWSVKKLDFISVIGQ